MKLKDRNDMRTLVEMRGYSYPTEQIVTDYEATRKKLKLLKRQKKQLFPVVDEVSYCRMNTEAAIQRATAALEMARLNLSSYGCNSFSDGKSGCRSLEEGTVYFGRADFNGILPGYPEMDRCQR